MSDPTQSDLTQETNALLRRLVSAVERKELGLTAGPPGSVTLYANRVKAPDGGVWYRWDRQAEEPIAVTDRYVRGRLTDVVCYEKSSEQGTTTKVRAALSAGRTRYEIETTLTATSGRGLVAGLLEAAESALANAPKRPITIGAEPADKDQVLFMNVFTDEGGKQYPDSMPKGEEALVSGLETVRSWMGLKPNPWTDRFQSTASHKSTASSSGDSPRSTRQNSSTRQNGQSREPRESEEIYDQSKKRGPSPEEAARKLVQKAREHDAGQLAGEVTVSGAPLSQKLRGLAEYAGRDKGYVARVCDALSIGGFDEVAVGQAQDVAQMLLDEDMLRENKSFEPDGEMPF
jgi:hypothetical protein